MIDNEAEQDLRLQYFICALLIVGSAGYVWAVGPWSGFVLWLLLRSYDGLLPH